VISAASAYDPPIRKLDSHLYEDDWLLMSQSNIFFDGLKAVPLVF